jgi:hypothetical protein
LSIWLKKDLEHAERSENASNTDVLERSRGKPLRKRRAARSLLPHGNGILYAGVDPTEIWYSEA